MIAQQQLIFLRYKAGDNHYQKSISAKTKIQTMENTIDNKVARGFQVEVPGAPEDGQTQQGGGPLGSSPAMCEGLGQEEGEGDDDEKVVDGEQKCMVCHLATTKLLMLRLDQGKVGTRKLCCLDCADIIVRAWLRLNGDQLDNLTPAQQRVSVITNLLERLERSPSRPFGKTVAGTLLLADYYSFCRGCLDFNTHVDIPDQPCNACQTLQRCCECRRSTQIVPMHKRCTRCPGCVHLDDPGYLCGMCSSRGPTQIPEPEQRPPGTCIECSGATATTSHRYCVKCTAHLKSLPGLKCRRCRLHPKPENKEHKYCARCRDDKRRIAEEKKQWTAMLRGSIPRGG